MLIKPDKAARKTRYETAYPAGIATTVRDCSLCPSLDAIDALQNLMCRWKFTPMSKEGEDVMKRHVVDFRRSVSAHGHESSIDEAEVDAGGSEHWTSPA